MQGEVVTQDVELLQAVFADEQGRELGHYVKELSGGVASSTPDGNIHRNGAVDGERLLVGGVEINAGWNKGTLWDFQFPQDFFTST